MKKLILIILVFLPMALPAHKVYQKDLASVIAEADLVMIAKVMNAITKREACETGYEFQLAPERILKGAFGGKDISFYYSVHFWDESKGCPSVHFILPPVPQHIREGRNVIAAFKKNGAGGGLWGTGMFDLSEIETVKKNITR